MIKVSVDMGNVERMLVGFSQSAVERAAKSAINRTLKGAKSQAAKKVTERYTIKSGEVRKSIKTKISGLTGELNSRVSRIRLTKFKYTPKKRPKKVTKGNPYLFAEVIKGQGGTLRHSFLANVQGAGIFERKGKPRLPIKHLYGPSVAEMLGKPPTSTYIMSKMEERLQINVMHEVSALLGGFRS